MDQWRTLGFKFVMGFVVLLWLDQTIAAEDQHHQDGGSRLSSRSGKAASCDCNSQGPWLPIFKPSASIKPLSPLSYLGVSGPESFNTDILKHGKGAPDNFIKYGARDNFKHIRHHQPDNFNHINHGTSDNFNHIRHGSPNIIHQIGPTDPNTFNPDILKHIGKGPPGNSNHIGHGVPDNLNNIRHHPDDFNHIGPGAPDIYNPGLSHDNFHPDSVKNIGPGPHESFHPNSLNHIGHGSPDSPNHIEQGTPESFNPGSSDDPGNQHMIHVHLIPHLYVPIMNQAGAAGGSEDHKIQENHFPHVSSAELSSLPQKHIEENHIIENHYDEFGNPYDPNQSEEVDEEDEGEITNVDIHTYSSDDQGGSSHTHYTKNNGVSYESFEQTAPSGTGDVSGDHGAQSSSYEKSNSYYTIPPNANIHHYNMHSEYNNLLSKEPNLHDLGDFPSKPVVYKQYEVHENTGEDTSHNNLAPAAEPTKLDVPLLPTSTPSVNEIKTNFNTVSTANNFKYPFGKLNLNPFSGLYKTGKNLLSLSSSGQQNLGVKNIQLKHNQYSPAHYSFITDQKHQNRLNSLGGLGQDLKDLESYSGHFPIKPLSLNSEHLPAISLDSNKGINSNLAFTNHHNPFNRVKFNKFPPLNSIKPIPSKLSAFPSHHLQDSYFKSKDYLKPLYSFKNLPALQPLFNAEPSNSNHLYLPRRNRNFQMTKLQPQILADYSVTSPNRQNHVRHLIMNRQYDVSKMRPPPPAQKQTWNEPPSPYQQIIPDSYAKITLPKTVYHLNLLRTPILSSSNIESRSKSNR